MYHLFRSSSPIKPILTNLDIRPSNKEHYSPILIIWLVVFPCFWFVKLYLGNHEKRLEKFISLPQNIFFYFFELNSEIYKLKVKEKERQKGKCARFPTCNGKILMLEGIFAAGLTPRGLLNLSSFLHSFLWSLGQ